MLEGRDIKAQNMVPEMCQTYIVVGEKLKATYERDKTKLIERIGLRDPHTIPRNLHLLSGKAKLKALVEGQAYIGRNNRFSVPTMETYRSVATSFVTISLTSLTF
jgi:hypothetical protein